LIIPDGRLTPSKVVAGFREFLMGSRPSEVSRKGPGINTSFNIIFIGLIA